MLLISLRGHGDSTGRFNDIGYSARHDVIAAVDFLERCRPGKPVIVHGTSLGAAAAVFAAGELGHRVRGFILECPYKDLKTAVRNRLENNLPPLSRWVVFQGLLVVAPLVLPDLEKISPVTAAGQIPEDVSVLILAGGKDLRARPEEAKAVYDRVRNHGEFVTFEGADHLRLHTTEPERYRKTVVGFMKLVGD